MKPKGASSDQDALREHIMRGRLTFAPFAPQAGIPEQQARAAMHRIREHRDIRVYAGELPDGTAPPWARPDAWLILTADGTLIPDPADPVKTGGR